MKTRKAYTPTEWPLAAQGLISYRYRLPHGFIMIGATDTVDALNEAHRSTNSPLSIANLEIWDGAKYVPVRA